MPRVGLRSGVPLCAVCLLAAAGCGRAGAPDLVWGHKGVQDGDLVRPRAAVIDHQDRLWLVDFTARIQAFDLDGKYLGITFTTPDYRNGRPSGLGVDREGNLIVSDSHYHCFRLYSADGTELRKLGGLAGTAPGELGYVSDVVQDSDGFWYVAEFGENHRISKFDAAGRFVKCWGSEGTAPGQMSRLRAIVLGPDGLLYGADAFNHRIQAFTRDGELVRCWGEAGTEPGKLSYPYDLAFGPDGSLYVVEFGNHRVSKFTADGTFLATWGAPGRGPGQLASPWALAVDRKGRVHVIDTENHRVQRVKF